MISDIEIDENIIDKICNLLYSYQYDYDCEDHDEKKNEEKSKDYFKNNYCWYLLNIFFTENALVDLIYNYEMEINLEIYNEFFNEYVSNLW